MDKQNVHSSVTCVTQSSLLQLMRARRTAPTTVEVVQETVSVEEVKSVFLPRLIHEWLEISLDEGHLQPSQPKVGKLEGWPQRPYLKNSLYVDLKCWCLKKGVAMYLIPSASILYQATDLIFDPLGNEKYQFPPLEVCRERFLKLKKENINDN